MTCKAQQIRNEGNGEFEGFHWTPLLYIGESDASLDVLGNTKKIYMEKQRRIGGFRVVVMNQSYEDPRL